MPRTTTRSATTTKGIMDVAELPASQLARRRRILAVASQLLERVELPEIQMRVVAEEAGVALGTLYRYFGSKDHLYAAVLLEWIDASTATRDTSDSPSDRVRARMHRSVRAFEKRPRFYRAQYLLQRSEDEAAKALFAEFSARNVDIIVRDLGGGLSRSSAEDRAHILLAAINTAVGQHCTQGRPIEVSYRIMDTCVDLVVGPLDDPS